MSDEDGSCPKSDQMVTKHPIMWSLFGACSSIILGIMCFVVYQQLLIPGLITNVTISQLNENITEIEVQSTAARPTAKPTTKPTATPTVTPTAKLSVKEFKPTDTLYIFLNGGIRKFDFLSPTLSELDFNKKDYLVFSDDDNYNIFLNNATATQKSRHVRVPTIHLKHLINKPEFIKVWNGGKAFLITYMWTQILEYLIDNNETRKYSTFFISENDIKICNQSLLDELVSEFINDSTINTIHLWDSCTKGRIQRVVKTMGKFHLIRKMGCGAVAAIIKPAILESVLKCLYRAQQIEKAMDGPIGGFAKCNMLTFYPNEILIQHIGFYASGVAEVNMGTRVKSVNAYCNDTVFYKY